MYHLKVSVSRGDQRAFGSWASDAPLPAAVSVATIEAPQDPPACATTVAPLADPGLGTVGASLQDIVSV